MGVQIVVNNRREKILDPKYKEKFEKYLSLFEIKEFLAFMNIMGVMVLDKEKTQLGLKPEETKENTQVAFRRDFETMIEEAYSKFCNFSRKERREIFKQMKIIYNCRLAAVHKEKEKGNLMTRGESDENVRDEA